MKALLLELGESAFHRCHELTEPGKVPTSELKAALAAVLRDHSRALRALQDAGIDTRCPKDAAPPRPRPVESPAVRGQDQMTLL